MPFFAKNLADHNIHETACIFISSSCQSLDEIGRLILIPISKSCNQTGLETTLLSGKLFRKLVEHRDRTIGVDRSPTADHRFQISFVTQRSTRECFLPRQGTPSVVEIPKLLPPCSQVGELLTDLSGILGRKRFKKLGKSQPTHDLIRVFDGHLGKRTRITSDEVF